MILTRCKAFTLVELLVVIAIVGLLSTIVLAVTSGVSEQGRIAKGLQFSQHLENGLGAYLVGRWSFDEGTDNTCLDGKDACDSSGWNNNGTFSGTSVWRCASVNESYTPSGLGCSLEFGDSQYVDAGANISLNPIDAITISAWAKINSLAGHDTIASKTGGGGSWWWGGWFLSKYSDYGSIETVFSDGVSKGVGFVSSTKMNVNQWHHIVVSYKGGTDGYLKLYQDGKNVSGYDSVTNSFYGTDITWNFGFPTSLFLSPSCFGIGGGCGRGSYPFSGFIDEVSAYNAALTTVQIEREYYVGLDNLLVKGLINETEYQKRLVLN